MQEEFSQDHVPTSNWAKFTNVGDFIKGTYTGQFFKDGDNGMPDQQVLELTNVETQDGIQEGNWYTPIKATNTFILGRIKGVKVGQRIGFKFTSVIPAKTKGHHDAKSITPYLWGMDEAYKVAEDFGGTVVTDSPF
jgi:hypothetical protein